MACESENKSMIMAGSNEASQSLIFEENQNKLFQHGKSFSSMNMEELVSSVWMNIAEETQPINIEHLSLPNRNLQSSLALPSPLSRKTVEEVLLEIHEEEESINPIHTPHPHEFGKMTLEEYLINEGVLLEMGRQPSFTSAPDNNNNVLSLGFVGCRNLVPSAVFGGSEEVNGCFFRGKIGGDGWGVWGSQVDDSVSGFCPSQVDDSVGQGSEIRGLKRRERGIDEWVLREKEGERRHKRLIKNRESAARSRARKQAYTIELEAELEHLSVEIVRLNKVLEEATATRCKKLMEAENEIQISSTERRRKVLRRTMSCQW